MRFFLVDVNLRKEIVFVNTNSFLSLGFYEQSQTYRMPEGCHAGHQGVYPHRKEGQLYTVAIAGGF